MISTRTVSALLLVLAACGDVAELEQKQPAAIAGATCEELPVCRCERAQVIDADGQPAAGWLCLDAACMPCGDAAGPLGGAYRESVAADGVPEVVEAVADVASCRARTTAERWRECRAVVTGAAAPDARVAEDWIPVSDPEFWPMPTPATLERQPGRYR